MKFTVFSIIAAMATASTPRAVALHAAVKGNEAAALGLLDIGNGKVLAYANVNGSSVLRVVSLSELRQMAASHQSVPSLG